jgi:FtsP/CotA-like multicopper oxidase with cupredoxin domain
MISRRDLLKLSGMVATSRSLTDFSHALAAPDFALEIAPVTLEFSPRNKFETLAYNNQVPGPLLRLKEGRPVTVAVTNHSNRPEVCLGRSVAGKGAPGEDLRGIVKDVVLVEAQTRVDVEFSAANPGVTLFHCHQQNHMDLGFMMLFDYV